MPGASGEMLFGSPAFAMPLLEWEKKTGQISNHTFAFIRFSILIESKLSLLRVKTVSKHNIECRIVWV